MKGFPGCICRGAQLRNALQASLKVTIWKWQWASWGWGLKPVWGEEEGANRPRRRSAATRWQLTAEGPPTRCYDASGTGIRQDGFPNTLVVTELPPPFLCFHKSGALAFCRREFMCCQNASKIIKDSSVPTLIVKFFVRPTPAVAVTGPDTLLDPRAGRVGNLQN